MNEIYEIKEKKVNIGRGLRIDVRSEEDVNYFIRAEKVFTDYMKISQEYTDDKQTIIAQAGFNITVGMLKYVDKLQKENAELKLQIDTMNKEIADMLVSE
ncbi:MAG: hypothetical protein LBN95_03130 [Prevotellaceae bacterium]|jgi:hypothetical protein|nr:hypothetical protein [Prevotellaceae bacterium]